MLIDSNGDFNFNDIYNYPEDNYNNLKEKALECSRCHLRKECKQVVMGEGNIQNRIMFIGEGPGATEDKLGRPFVGRAGKLLNKIFSALDIKREEVYISNIVKCRPPDNRKPTKKEAQSCFPILQSEIKIIQPLVIVPLGATALQFLIDHDTSITKSRGKWIERGEYYILPTFHPAYLLRNKKMKKYSWQDFKLIKKAIQRIKELKEKSKTSN